MQRCAGRASEFPRRAEDFGLDARLDAQRKRWGDAPRPPPKISVGRAPTYARRPEKFPGAPPRRPDEMCPDLQTKCVPTSSENAPRRPEKIDECITENGRSLWTSGHIFFGRRGTFPLDVGGDSRWRSGHISSGRRGGSPIHLSGRRGTFPLEVGHMSGEVRSSGNP